MERSRFGRPIAVAALAAALAGAVAASVPAADHGAGARLHVTATFTATALGPDQCGGIRVTATGTATGTHVGTGTWEQSECVVVVFDPATLTVTVHVSGVGRITAANGDVLVVDYEATTAPPDMTTGEIHPRGTYTVDGTDSTGRFAGLSGMGSLAVDGIANDGETAVFDGTIDP